MFKRRWNAFGGSSTLFLGLTTGYAAT